MLCASSFLPQFKAWIRDYDKIQTVAVFLIFIQIGCALVGSIGALYNGVLLINLAVALFALVAIQSSSQSLGRTYAVLLLWAIVLDVSWFFLFSREIWNISSEKYGTFFIFSLRVALCMQIVGFSVRLLSSLLWIQMYRLGASCVDMVYREADFDLRNSFLSSSTHGVVRQSSHTDEILGGSIYDPSYYSSLFEDAQDNVYACGGYKQNTSDDGSGSSSTSEASQLKPCIINSFRVIDNDIEVSNRQSS